VLKQNPVRLVACIRSSLERRRLVEEREQAIREGEQRFRQLADFAPVLIWMSDAAGSLQYFNRAWLVFRGRSESQERDNGWIEGVHPADRPRCEQTLQTKISTLQPCQIEFRLRRHDGSYRWILCNGTPFYSGKDRFSGYIGSGIDVTDVKEAESARGHDHELTNALVESLPWPAYAKDSSGRFVAVNQAASLLLGRSRDAFNGRTNAQLGLDTEFAALEAREIEVLQSGTPSFGQPEGDGPDSRFTISPWGGTKDGVSGIVAVDVSKPGSGLSSQSRHDINNLVAIIRMYAEYLGEQPELGERILSKVHQIADASEKLGTLISTLAEPGDKERTKAR
jgi:PAS domain S-box-containing protein